MEKEGFGEEFSICSADLCWRGGAGFWTFSFLVLNNEYSFDSVTTQTKVSLPRNGKEKLSN